MNKPNPQGFLAHAITALLTAVVTLSGSYWQFKGSEVGVEPAYVDVLQRRVGELEKQITAVNQTLISVQAENAMLRLQLRDDYYRSPRSLLWRLLDAFDTPAWCKEWGGSGFTMAHINGAYEAFYRVTNQRYKGLTDHDVFPDEVADTYAAHDLLLYSERRSDRFVEPVMVAGSLVEMLVYKVYHRLPDGEELVCGIQMEK